MKKLTLIFCLLAFSVAAYGQTMTIKVYFLNEKDDPDLIDCTAVKPTERTIPKTKGVAKAALEELFKGVTEEEKAKGFTSFPPEDTKDILKSIKIKNKAAYVNFNSVVYKQLGTATASCGGGSFFSSVEETLKQFKTIKKIFYAIEGNPADFYEWAQVGECPAELKNCSGKNF